MKRSRRVRWLVPLALLLLTNPAHAQGGGDVYWHIDPTVETCSMVIDPSLTREQWKTFTEQAGALLSFKSLASAEPFGRWNVSLGVDYSITPVDQRDPAWINTFTHPDANCPLGDEIQHPTLRARVGVTDKVDVGAYWTTAPGANYGFVGGEARFAFLPESPRVPAAAVSASVVVLTGVNDFDFSVYSLGLTASKRVSSFVPYLGVRGNLAVGTETTSKVDLGQEELLRPQGFVGSTYSIWKLNLAAEYNLAQVNTFAFVIDVHR